jgi:SAM-dependent methyltransferase
MLGMSFKDYFSKQSSDYAKYRPSYPNELFEYIASLIPTRTTAWDCATGNGQVAQSLAHWFSKVYATDASKKQIAQAFRHERIDYRVATAEASGLPDQSVDLITVGQALHWFNLDLFYCEVQRVLRPNGLLVVWCYGLFDLPNATEDIQQEVRSLYQLVEPFWPPERDLVRDEYRTIPFPFVELTPPRFSMTLEWSTDDLVGYLTTWSATQRFAEQQGWQAIAAFADRLKCAWGNPDALQLVQWPLHLRIGTTP